MHERICDTVDIVYSPDEHGYYLQEFKLDGSNKSRVTKQLYKDKSKLILLYNMGKIKWTKWD